MSQTTRESAKVLFRVTEEEDEAIEAAAKRAGLTKGVWLRFVAAHAAGRTELAEQLRRAYQAGLLAEED